MDSTGANQGALYTLLNLTSHSSKVNSSCQEEVYKFTIVRDGSGIASLHQHLLEIYTGLPAEKPDTVDLRVLYVYQAKSAEIPTPLGKFGIRAYIHNTELSCD